MSAERIIRELNLLREGGQHAEVATSADGRQFVLYHSVPVGGVASSLPPEVDVIVPVPSGYPASLIDLAGLPQGSPLIPRVKGGTNSQGQVSIGGRAFSLASYHPHQGGGGPPWDQNKHGFHTYFDHLLSWLERLT